MGSDDRGDSFPFDFEPNGIPFGSENRTESCPHDHLIPFYLKGHGNKVFSVRRERERAWGGNISRGGRIGREGGGRGFLRQVLLMKFGPGLYIGAAPLNSEKQTTCGRVR